MVSKLAQYDEAQFVNKLIHAGTKWKEIEQIVEKAEKEKSQPVWIFLDEINTSQHLYKLSELICHRRIVYHSFFFFFLLYFKTFFFF